MSPSKLGFLVGIAACSSIAAASSNVDGSSNAACISLQSDEITAGDLAHSNGAFAALDPHLVLGWAPFAGSTRRMRSAELVAIAERHQLSLANTPADICLERASEALTAERLAGALQSEAGDRPTIVDFSRTRIPTHARLEFPAADLSPSGMWRGRAVSGNRSTALWAKIERTKLAGTTIDRTKGGVPDSSAARLITRGDHVTVEVRSGRARIRFSADAESAGHAGDSILLRNPENGRLFQAKILERGKVLIQK
jgi:hypothetical protein